jgi:hypothetical protein
LTPKEVPMKSTMFALLVVSLVSAGCLSAYDHPSGSPAYSNRADCESSGGRWSEARNACVFRR